MPNSTTCDDCGKVYFIGDWWLCPHGQPQGAGASYRNHWDEHIAPPPGPDFKPAPGVILPEYREGKGYNIRTLADRRKLERLNLTREKGMRKAGGGYR